MLVYVYFLSWILSWSFLLCLSEFGRYSGRVRFESGSPTENSALLIPSTEESDEGRYTCHISTFPNGNFERHITLTVWSKSFPPPHALLFLLSHTFLILWELLEWCLNRNHLHRRKSSAKWGKSAILPTWPQKFYTVILFKVSVGEQLDFVKLNI